MTRNFRVLLVFSRYMSLREWARLGMFDREVALYRRLAERGVAVDFVTYGGGREEDYAAKLPGISIHYNRFGLKARNYERLMPLLHAGAFRRADLIKTNQVSSAYASLAGAGFWRRPLIARMGFMPSDFAIRQYGEGSAQHLAEDRLERRLFSKASAISVTTQAMSENIVARLPGLAPLVKIIPNYVDTQLFAPAPSAPKDYDLIFIGRLAKQKNIPTLLAALKKTGAKSLLIGDGHDAELVQRAIAAAQGLIEWRPSVANHLLPGLMARSRLFVLPSLWEGHPKTLLEAMACGAAVIGSDAPGISSEIEHGRTGWLCQPEPGALAEAISYLLGQPQLRSDLGDNARRHILATCSLDRVVELEMENYRQTMKARP